MMTGRFISTCIRRTETQPQLPYRGSILYNTDEKIKIGETLFDFERHQFKTWDGNSWVFHDYNEKEFIEGIMLSPEAQDALDWVIERMIEERKLEELAETEPMVKSALDEVKDATNRLHVVLKMLQD